MEDYINIGKRIPKADAHEKVTGKAIYIQDLKLPGMLYGKILYSKHPHANILRIDTTKAEKLPGVRAVLTGYNTPTIKFGFYKDNVPLKRDKVRSYWISCFAFWLFIGCSPLRAKLSWRFFLAYFRITAFFMHLLKSARLQ